MTTIGGQNGRVTASDEKTGQTTSGGVEGPQVSNTASKKRGRPAGSRNKPKARPGVPAEVADYVRSELQSILALCELQNRNPALPSALKAKAIMGKLDSRLRSLIEMLDPACEVLENGGSDNKPD